MHKLLKLVYNTMHHITTCPVCLLPVASCECDKQITPRVLTVIALADRDLQEMALVVTMEDEKLHTDARPFCSDVAYCPCHEVLDTSTKRKYTEYYAEYIGTPYREGLLSYEEVQRIYHNAHI